ncbi:MAG: FAD-dependent oxidoreductase [Burkholderiaceae bacterium]
MTNKKWALAGIILALLIGAFWFDLGQYASLDALKQNQTRMAEALAESPFTVVLGFSAVYVVVTALSLPGAVILTLAAGAWFGLVLGTLVVSVASTIGATLAMLSARYLLRDWVQRRWADRLAVIQQGLDRDGPFYLFSLRLLPIVPFFLLNLVMGLTQMRVRTYFWISQVGMLAGTVVYVNAGTALAKINQLSDVLSPSVWGAFALLAALPWILRRALDWRHRQRVYARWQSVKPKQFDRNLIVIGGGAAGLVSAYIAAVVKAKVTLVEAHKMGGDCLNYGCVPSKALIKSANLAHKMKHADRYGLTPASPDVRFKAVMTRVQAVVKQVAPHDSVERYTALGVDVVSGHATIVNPWTVEITDAQRNKQTLTTRSIVIAAGAKPLVPPLPGLDTVGYLTSDTLWEAFAARDTLPQRIVVLGGGPIGCELTQALARLGAHVTQVEMGDRLLPREDEVVSELIAKTLASEGVEVLTAHQAIRCEQQGEEKMLVVKGPSGDRAIAFDELICAVGRVARLDGYGLEALGITAQRTIETDAYLQTVYPNIYAAGDVAGPYQFTHTASHQAWYASVNALFGDFKRFAVDYRVIPWATFVDPEVARVGLNEQAAKAAGIAYEVTQFPLDDLDRAITDSETAGFIQVLTPPGKDRILGVTIVGAQASEILAEYVLAMKHGLGLNRILGTIHTYPTMAEANKYVAGEWKRAHAPKRLLAWVERFQTWRRG